MFTGSLVALVTPFKNGKLDEEGLGANIKFQIENGTDGLVVCATTGESPTLTEEEKETVIKISVEACNGKIPVIASTGTNSTIKTLKATDKAKELGVSEKTVWRWIKKDELKAHKLGGQWRISPEDREIFLKLRRK